MTRTLFVILTLCCCVVGAQASALKSLHIKDDRTIGMKFDAHVHYHYFQLNNPPRFVVDIDDLTQFPSWHVKHLNNVDYVRRVRAAKRHDDTLRLVFDLSHDYQLTLSRVPKHPSQIVLKLANPSNVESSNRSGNHEHNAKRHKRSDEAIHVVIDPGHGGVDPGAAGPKGHKEKNIVLALARRIEHHINQYPGFKAFLTRQRDVYLSLRQRLNIARQKHADMFIAVHADAYKNHHAKGASVYALSKHGGTSEAARWLARKENESEMGGVDLSNKSRVLKSVLLELSQTASVKTSLSIGHKLLNQLTQVTDLHYAQVEQAAFVVLKSPDIPSVLLESGFISNPQEERRLRSQSYQTKLAKAIAKGVHQYFVKHPPQGSWLDMRNRNMIDYQVKKGDNLSKLGQRYHVSVSLLKQINDLNTNQLQINQKLRIPVIKTSKHH